MLEVRDLCKSFGGHRVTRNVSFHLERGARQVILGPNGAGKTTLFNLLAGTLRPTSGDILLDGRSIASLSVDDRAKAGISRSYQKNNLFEGLSVRDNLSLAAAAGLGLSGGLLRDSFRNREVCAIVEDVSAQVSLASVLDLPVNEISYGNRRQLEVGLALATRPKLLLMDEPTSGIGPDMIEAFTALLKGLPKSLTVLVIEHDMKLAFEVADRMTVLNYGEVVFDGRPEDARQDARVREIYLGEGDGHA
jgi:ABC-type branched-subunit amino acid transport system ATPase component